MSNTFFFYQKICTYDLTAIPTSLWFKGYGMLVKSRLLIVNRISQTLFCGLITASVFPFSYPFPSYLLMMWDFIQIFHTLVESILIRVIGEREAKLRGEKAAGQKSSTVVPPCLVSKIWLLHGNKDFLVWRIL